MNRPNLQTQSVDSFTRPLDGGAGGISRQELGASEDNYSSLSHGHLGKEINKDQRLVQSQVLQADPVIEAKRAALPDYKRKPSPHLKFLI